jgi:hypothetical protein
VRFDNFKLMKKTRLLSAVFCMVFVAIFAAAQIPTPQTTYKPKFKGDPARSDSEAAALGYMRTFLRAQRIYKKKNNHYATSLLALVHTGSFTRRMVSTDRDAYTVQFTPHKEKDTFEIRMTPKQPDATRRSFFADEDGTIRANDQGEADEHSPVLRAD